MVVDEEASEERTGGGVPRVIQRNIRSDGDSTGDEMNKARGPLLTQGHVAALFLVWLQQARAAVCAQVSGAAAKGADSTGDEMKKARGPLRTQGHEAVLFPGVAVAGMGSGARAGAE